MAEQKKTNEALNVEEALTKSEAFLIKNKKAIIGVVVAVIIVIAGMMLYKNLYSEPREAKAQAALIDLMKADELLTDEEWAYFKRGRNANSHTHAKHTAVLTYRISTGFEALMGYLQLSGQQDRLAELAQWCIQQVEEGRTKHED